jgi:sugar phosphate isomerase/epimerase
MQLCFDATRFGTGLDGGLQLAAEKGISAIEYSFAPFTTPAKSKGYLDGKEKKFLASVCKMSKQLGVTIACLNLDFCLKPEKKANKTFSAMVGKLAHVAEAVDCRKISILLAPGDDEQWLEMACEQLLSLDSELKSANVGLLIRLATAPEFRGRSLKSWNAMAPQDWRDLISTSPGIGLSFSPADCVWLGIDYLKILPGLASAVEHIEAHDIEIVRELLNDSGIYGPLWWRYRLPGKGQVDWTQLIEALKLYEFKGAFSIHLDDEFVPVDQESLEEALAASVKFLTPLVSDYNGVQSASLRNLI